MFTGKKEKQPQDLERNIIDVYKDMTSGNINSHNQFIIH